MNTSIKARLRAAIFSGAVGLLPSVALADGASNPKSADTPESFPDHAQAETHGPSDLTSSSAEVPAIVPDHAQAEARSAMGTAPTGDETTVPDHATAERRGASPDAE